MSSYVFDGWKFDGESDYYAGDLYVMSGDARVFGHYNHAYKVRFVWSDDVYREALRGKVIDEYLVYGGIWHHGGTEESCVPYPDISRLLPEYDSSNYDFYWDPPSEN